MDRLFSEQSEGATITGRQRPDRMTREHADAGEGSGRSRNSRDVLHLYRWRHVGRGGADAQEVI
jgi:hypothetical protein